MTEQLVVPDREPVILRCLERGEAFKREALALVPASEEDEIVATNLLAVAVTLQKEAESRRVLLVKPLNDHVKKINELFRQVLAPFVEGDAWLRKQLLAYAREKTRLAEAAAAAAERQRRESEALLRDAERAEAEGHPGVAEGLLNTAVAKADAAKGPFVAPPAKTLVTSMGARTIKKTWTFRVTDLAQIPRGFLLLNEKSVREAIDAGLREIPGLHIYQEDSLSVRG